MKNLYKIIGINLVVVLSFSCKEAPKVNAFVQEKKETQPQEIIAKVNSDSISRNVVFNFYTWYINDVYLKRNYDYNRASYKKFDDKFGLDTESYKQKLEEISFFSKSFKQELLKRNEECSEAMLKSDLEDFDPEYDADFYLGKNNTKCDFLWNMDWFGNQEDENNKFKILDKFNKEGNNYIYLVQSYMYDKSVFQYEVKVIENNGSYKINSINRK